MKISSLLRIFYCIGIIVLPGFVYGQYYNLGQDPASLRWRQIITPHFRVIYPENFEFKAQKMMPMLDFIYAKGTKTLAFLPKQVPFIVHNYNIEPNALTVWTPKRIELYSCPPQDAYPQDWLDQLIIHEYRHVVQMDRTNQGFTKILSWLTGEQAAAAINGVFVPSWFMEGDAVCAETALSRSGRGRIPGFEMPLRAQITQKGAFSYDKAALGSYKTFVPNRYELGYSLVANVRRKYGFGAWVKALDEVARKPYILTPFNHGLKKATGYGKEKLYRSTMIEMDSMWKYQDSNTPKTSFRQLSASIGKNYENSKYPYYLNDTLIVAECSSLDDITRFVVFGPDGYRKILTTPGFLSSDIYSILNLPISVYQGSKTNTIVTETNSMVAWTETINDARWEQRNYSEIKIYDCKTRVTKRLSRKSRFFAPSFSPDGQTLSVVEVDPANKSSILLINAKNGMKMQTIITSDTDFYMTPKWSEDGSKIVFTKLDNKGKSIVLYDMVKQIFITLVPPTYTEISNPVFAQGYVLFNGSYSGIENIYAVDIKNNEVFQVVSAEFGACNPALSPDGSKIVYSNYSSSGYGLVEARFNPDSWKNLSKVSDFSPSLYKYLVKEEDGILDLAGRAKSITYPSQPYKKAAHIFKFHSWAPAYINYLAGENGTGISFMSQNELSTATTVVGYKYDMTENTGKVTADFSWKAWYPLIDLNSSYGARTAYTDSSVRYNFNETIISGGFTLPLIFTGGKYYKGLRLQLYTSWYNITDNTSPKENKLKGTIHTLDYSIYAYRFIKQSGKDIYPRWGQVLTGSFRHSPFGDNNLGRILSAGARLYFPGLIIHHGLRLDVNLQKRKPGQYAYSNQINLPRGYFLIDENTLACFALNYKFPFAYPDFALGPIAYFKRLKANLFFDGGVGSTDKVSRKLQSTGVEISSDLHILRFVFPVDLGVRLGYRPIENRFFTDLLFSVNLSN